eukprot:NODE_33_length_36935_cov_1.609241.p2 type:complete len:934 gc:universal NODE_33_length_36935_cov_1.609241:30709-33510(+)
MHRFLIAIYEFAGDSSQDEMSIKENDLMIAISEDDQWLLVILLSKLIDNFQVLKLVGNLDEKLDKMRSIGGLVPKNYVQDYVGEVGYALHDYSAQDEEEHSLTEGEQIQLYDAKKDDWIFAMKGGNIGLIPRSYVEKGEIEVIKQPSSEKFEDDDNIFMTVMDTAPMNIAYHSASHIPTSTSSRKHGTQGALGVSNTSVLFVNLKVLTVYKNFNVMSCKVVKMEKKILQIEDMFFKLESSKDVEEFLDSYNKAKIGKSVERDLVKETMQNGPKSKSDNEGIRKENIKVLHDTVQKTASGTPAIKKPAPVVEPKYGKVLYDFVAEEIEEISVSNGQFLLLLKEDQDWIEAQLLDEALEPTGKKGWVPLNYVNFESKENLRRLSRKMPSAPIQQVPALPERDQMIQEPKLDPVQFRLPTPTKPIKDKEAVVFSEPPQLPAREKPPLPDRIETPKSAEKEDVVMQKPEMPPRPLDRPKMPPRPNTSQKAAPPKANSLALEQVDAIKELPNSENLRVWKDKSGGFSVRAEFLGLFDDKVHLFKTNGVKIGVPLEKLSDEDRQFISKKLNDNTIVETNSTAFQGFDWLPWFMSNCSLDEKTARKYSEIFVKERIDLSLLREMTKEDLRSLGFAQGDVIRILKATNSEPSNEIKDQVMEKEKEVNVQRIDEYFADKMKKMGSAISNTMTSDKKSDFNNRNEYPLGSNNLSDKDKFGSLKESNTSRQQIYFNSVKESKPSHREPINNVDYSQDSIITKVREDPKPIIVERKKEIPKSQTYSEGFANPPTRQNRAHSGSEKSSILPTDSASQIHSPTNIQSNYSNYATRPSQSLYYNPALQNMQRQQQMRPSQPLVAQPIQSFQQSQPPNSYQQPVFQMRPNINQIQQGYQMQQQFQHQNPQMYNQLQQVPQQMSNAQFVQQYQNNRPGPQAFPQQFQPST